MFARNALICCALLFYACPGHSQSPVQQRITLDAQRIFLVDAIILLEQRSDVSFSYNADILPSETIVNIHAQNEKLSSVLDEVLKNTGVSWQFFNNYVIIYRPVDKRLEYENYRGQVLASITDQPVGYATVYSAAQDVYGFTDRQGRFSISLNGPPGPHSLGIARRGFRDTMVTVYPGQQNIVHLQSEIAITGPINSLPAGSISANNVDEIGVVGFVVNPRQSNIADNQRYTYHKAGQVSFLPMVTTNGMTTGATVNNLSLNVIAGYNHAVEGIELGGLLNVNRTKLAGLQIAGFGNVTGDYAHGLQVAGFFNSVLGSVKGVQMAGFSNYAMDTVTGIQVAGFNNLLAGKMKGAQISGFNNLATGDFKGVQVAGFSNLAIHGTVYCQGSGFVNYAQHLTGSQISGFSNITSKSAQGGQLTGFFNYAHDLYGVQFSGAFNVTGNYMRGAQVGLVNYTTTGSGVQLGLINISDSMRGLPIGLFTYSLNGYHHFQVHTNERLLTAIAFKTGLDHFYNIYQVGYHPQGGGAWMAGFGFGTAHTFKNKLEINLDITGNTFSERGIIHPVGLLGNADFQLGWRFGKYFGLFAGPSFNTLIKSQNATLPAFVSQYPPHSEWTSEKENYLLTHWMGFKCGLRF